MPARHPGRVAGTLFAALVIAAVLYSTFTNPRWGWAVFAEWFFAEPVLAGLGRTLLLTALAHRSPARILGTALALARVSKSPLLAGLSWGYIWLLRSIPLIVLLLVLNNLGYLYETITIGVPFTDTVLVELSDDAAADAVRCRLHRSDAQPVGLLRRDRPRRHSLRRSGAARSGGGARPARAAARPSVSCCRRRCARSCRPGFNEIIGLAKSTSMVYVLALPELFYTVQVIYRRNLEVIPLLMVATVWYLDHHDGAVDRPALYRALFSKGRRAIRSRCPSRLSSAFPPQRLRQPISVADATPDTGFRDAAVLRSRRRRCASTASPKASAL